MYRYLHDKRIKQSQKWLKRYNDQINKQCQSCFLLSDPTRLKIMLILEKHKELCVTDLSKIIGISVSAISHQLDKLQGLNAITNKKMGQNVCYFINSKNEVARCLMHLNRLKY